MRGFCRSVDKPFKASLRHGKANFTVELPPAYYSPRSKAEWGAGIAPDSGRFQSPIATLPKPCPF